MPKLTNEVIPSVSFASSRDDGSQLVIASSSTQVEVWADKRFLPEISFRFTQLEKL